MSEATEGRARESGTQATGTGSTPVSPAPQGAGPLLQRDYWAVVDECAASPAEVGRLLAARFCEFPPPELVEFERRPRRTGHAQDAADLDVVDPHAADADPDLADADADSECAVPNGPLEVGDELDVRIRWAGDFAVRVIHRDRQSLTLATLEGHPEAGRITFGAYRNARGDVVIHIRSRARASSTRRYFDFLTGGDPMQTNTWTDFLNRLAVCVGNGVRGYVHADKRQDEDRASDRDPCAPTFEAR